MREVDPVEAHGIAACGRNRVDQLADTIDIPDSDLNGVGDDVAGHARGIVTVVVEGVDEEVDRADIAFLDTVRSQGGDDCTGGLCCARARLRDTVGADFDARAHGDDVGLGTNLAAAADAAAGDGGRTLIEIVHGVFEAGGGEDEEGDGHSEYGEEARSSHRGLLISQRLRAGRQHRA